MPFKPITTPKIAEAIIEQIEDLIAYGVLRPGETLPPERALAEELDVSRASLRDALETLAARGLVERRRGSGVVVAAAIDSALADPLVQLIGARPEALSDFIAFRRRIEADAAAQAARDATAADKAHLASIVARMREAHAQAAGDNTESLRLDFELHTAIVDACGNLVTTYVMRTIRRAFSQAQADTRAAIYARPGVPEQLLAQHAAIVEAIAAGDASGAAAASDRHLDFVAAELRASRAEAARAERAALRPDRLKNQA